MGHIKLYPNLFKSQDCSDRKRKSQRENTFHLFHLLNKTDIVQGYQFNPFAKNQQKILLAGLVLLMSGLGMATLLGMMSHIHVSLD